MEKEAGLELRPGENEPGGVGRERIVLSERKAGNWITPSGEERKKKT